MFKKLGKKGLLSLLTVAAVVVTTVGSFAVWDVLDATSTGTLTMTDKAVIVSTTSAPTYEETAGELGVAPVYQADVVFNVENVPDPNNVQLALDCSIKNGENSVKDHFTVAVTEADGASGLSGLTDADVTEGANSYHITITPDDTDDARALAEAGTALTVDVKGTLSEKTP